MKQFTNNLNRLHCGKLFVMIISPDRSGPVQEGH
jgi:hypothetical protein